MNWEVVFTALAIGVPSSVLGIMGLRASSKKDAASERSGITADHRAGTLQVIESLNLLVDQYQEEVKTVRAERDVYRLEVIRLQKRYGINGETPGQ